MHEVALGCGQAGSPQGPGDGGGEQKRVDEVEHAAKPAERMARVFRAGLPLDERLGVLPLLIFLLLAIPINGLEIWLRTDDIVRPNESCLLPSATNYAVDVGGLGAHVAMGFHPNSLQLIHQLLEGLAPAA